MACREFEMGKVNAILFCFLIKFVRLVGTFPFSFVTVSEFGF